jgi:hypothetical protein
MPRKPATASAAAAASRRPSSDETRRHARFAVALPVKCTEWGSGTPRNWRGRTADVSGGGFAVELPTKLASGAALTVEVRTALGPMRLDAEVLWVRKAAGADQRYRHGLRLAEGSEVLDLPLHALLGEWLRKMAGRERRPAKPPAAPKRAPTPPRASSARGASGQGASRRGKSRAS